MDFYSSLGDLLFSLLAVNAAVLVGLVSILAARARIHWFLRIAIVGAVLALALPIGAFEPLLTFFVQSAIVMIVLSMIRRVRREATRDAGAVPPNTTTSLRGRWRFSLADLLLVTTAVGVVFAVLATAPADAWEGWEEQLIVGGAFAAVSLAATWVAFGSRRLWLRILVFSGCAFVAARLLTSLHVSYGIWSWGHAWPTALLTALGWSVMVACLVLMRRSTHRPTHQAGGDARPGTPPDHQPASSAAPARVALALLLFALLLPQAAIYYRILTPTPVPDDPLPDPNAYHDLVTAGSAMTPLPFGAAATPAALRTFVEKNAEAYSAAHLAVRRPCQVPVDYSNAETHYPNDGSGAFRGLARAFEAEGKVAEIEGRTSDAWQIYLDTVRLGRAASRGGLFGDYVTGIAVEGIGLQGMAESWATLKTQTTPDDCRRLIKILHTLDQSRPLLDEVFERDKAWYENAYDHWAAGVNSALSDLSGFTERIRAAFEASANREPAKTRLLIAELALHAYRQEHGELPTTLDELVPDLLPAVPIDPFSGKPLIYRRDGTNYILYSIGEDRLDDGGFPQQRYEDQGETHFQGDMLIPQQPKPQP